MMMLNGTYEVVLFTEVTGKKTFITLFNASSLFSNLSYRISCRGKKSQKIIQKKKKKLPHVTCSKFW